MGGARCGASSQARDASIAMPESVIFPAGFLWGAATSAHQVEGDNRHNDWWAWEQAGKAREQSGTACDHYARFAEDFDLAKALHHNAHRFSIEWSRIEPEPEQWETSALEHYRQVVDALRARDLEPIVTLFHFTSPQWFSERGGWCHPQAGAWFARYVERVLEAIGPSVRYWITFNEPMIYLYQGYVAGVWPPGERSWRTTWRALAGMLRAHRSAYWLIHQRLDDGARPPIVGFAKNMVVFAPCDPRSLRDRLARWARHRIFNDFVLAAFRRGRIGWWPGRRRCLDIIGLNYYTRDFVHFAGWVGGRLFGQVCSVMHHRDVGERNMLGWEIYPEGIHRCLRNLARYRLPILVTENGICTADDAQRWRFIRGHLAQVARAMREGASVVGYLHWSLMDNFEWHEGFGPRFGLVEVDYATQARRVRPSAERFAQVCRTGRLPSDGAATGVAQEGRKVS